MGGVRGLLRGNKVDILEGTASFADTHTLTVGDKQVSAEYIICLLYTSDAADE